MEIEYICGSKEDFYSFIDSISLDDKVAILSHTDLDGVSSALFLEKILEAKRIEISYLDFLSIEKDMVKKNILKLKEKGITKVFFCDLGIDSIDLEGFNELREEMGVFLIDHHPMNSDLADKTNVLKTSSSDCSGLVVFELGKDVFDTKAWEWLVCAAIFSDFAYKKESHLDYVKSIYPDVTFDNISSSVPGINSRKIASALIYHEGNQKYVYELLKKRDLDNLSNIHEIVEDEINRLVEEFSSKAEYYPDKKLYFYEVDSKFNVVSIVTSMVSKMKPEYSFVFMQRGNDFIKFSSRNQSGEKDMGALMKKATFGLEGASGGGHVPAAAAKILPHDLDEFKRQLLE